MTPLRLVSPQGLNGTYRTHVLLKSGRRTFRVPLRTQEGYLQGVYRTPSGEIIEFRHTPKNAVVETLPSRRKMLRSPQNRVIVHGTNPLLTNEGLVAESSSTLHHFKVNPEYMGTGVGDKLLSIGTRALAAKTGKAKTLVTIGVAHPDTAAMLKKRGWFGVTKQDKERLAKLDSWQRSGGFIQGGDIQVSKFHKQTPQDDPSKYHQIEITNPKGKRRILLIPVRQTKAEKALLKEVVLHK